MLLHEIIKENENDQNSILVELLLPYKKSLFTIFSREYKGEPVLMVTDVFNAAQYTKIVPGNELIDAICAYLDDYNCMDEESENFASYETICYNSILLKDL